LFQQQVDPRLQSKELEAKVDFRKSKKDYARAKQGEGGNIEILKRMGALSFATSTVSESERRKVIASQLPMHAWPEHKIVAVAVDAESGERRVFDRTAGVELIDAVAASCAAPGMSPPITIEGHRYMDGGCYSIDNADLAGGFDRVLILTLKAGVPPSCVVSLEAALETLQRNGAKVVVVRPDEATEAAFAAVGGNLLDPSVREGAARAGREQGRNIATHEMASLWQ
jgi:NTE family protein